MRWFIAYDKRGVEGISHYRLSEGPELEAVLPDGDIIGLWFGVSAEDITKSVNEFVASGEWLELTEEPK